MAAEAASFRTDIDSMSLGSTLSNDDSNPSMMTSGDESLSVPMPRTVIVPPSAPGWPEVWVTCTPVILPCRASDTSVIGRFLKSAVETVDTAPVSFSLLVVP